MQSFESVCKVGMAVPGLFFTETARRRREGVRGVESRGVIAVGKNDRYIQTVGESKRRGHGNTCCRDINKDSTFPFRRKEERVRIYRIRGKGKWQESSKAEEKPREPQTGKATSTQRNEWHEGDARKRRESIMEER